MTISSPSQAQDGRAGETTKDSGFAEQKREKNWLRSWMCAMLKLRDKSTQLESPRAHYRERDNGRFTPTRVTPPPSVVAVSVDGDDDPNRDEAMFDVGVGVGSGDALCAGQVDGQGERRLVEESGPPPRTVLQVETEKRRCMGPGFQ